MEYIRYTLRNNSIRKDAAYIITVEDASTDKRSNWNATRAPLLDTDDPLFTVTGHWGPWRSYEQDPTGLTGLRNQTKYTGTNYSLARGVCSELLADKNRKGYRQIGAGRMSSPPARPIRPVRTDRDITREIVTEYDRNRRRSTEEWRETVRDNVSRGRPVTETPLPPGNGRSAPDVSPSPDEATPTPTPNGRPSKARRIDL